MKQFRKIVSMLVILSMLFSVMAVALSAIASATVIGTDGLPTEMTGADGDHIYLDFENTASGALASGSVGGIVASDYGTGISYVDDGTGNMGLQAVTGSACSVVFGSSEDSAYGVKDATDPVGGLALQGDVTYRITFRYKILAGSYSSNDNFDYILAYGTGFYPDGTRKQIGAITQLFKFDESDTESVEKVDKTYSGATASCYQLKQDSEWMTLDRTFTVSAANIQSVKDTYSVENVNLYFQIKGDQNATTPRIKQCRILIDDVYIYDTAIEGTVYNYNFVDDEDGTTNYTNASGMGNYLSFGAGDATHNVAHLEALLNSDVNGDGTVGSSTKTNLASYVVTKDMIDGTTLAGDGAPLVNDGQTEAGGAYLGAGNGTAYTATGAWKHYRMFLKDPDIANGGWLTVSTGKKYVVTAKFKAGNGMGEGDKFGLAIGTGTGDISAVLTEHSYVYNEEYNADEPWYYITAIIDGDGTVYDSTTNKTVNASGKMIGLIPKYTPASGSNNAGLFIDSVEVTVFNKSVIGEKSVVVNIGDGSAQPTVELGEYGNRNEFGETVMYTKDGENWFKLTEDCIVTGKDDSATGSTYTMDEGSVPGIVNTYTADYETVDSDNGDGKMFKLTSTGDIARVIFNDTLKSGSKYYITFDAKASAAKSAVVILQRTATTSANNARAFIMGYGGHNDSEAMSNSGVAMYKNGVDVSSTDRSTHATMMTCTYDTAWASYGLIIDTTDPGFVANLSDTVSNGVTYLALGVRTNGTVLYIDNLTVTEITDVAITEPTEEMDVVGSIRRENKKTVDGNVEYVSAGLRFRGYIDTAVKTDAAEIGFVVAPAKGVADDTAWFEFGDDGKLKSTVARSAACYSTADGTDIVYSTDDNGTYYQLILTGLSTEEGRTAYKTRYNAVMYVKNADGEYTYYTLGQSSYEEVKAAYRAMDIDGWYKY